MESVISLKFRMLDAFREVPSYMFPTAAVGFWRRQALIFRENPLGNFSTM